MGAAAGAAAAGAAVAAEAAGASVASVTPAATMTGSQVRLICVSSCPRQVARVLGDQSVGQALRGLGLADQGVRKQRVVHPVAPAADRSVEREFLVRVHVRDQ